MPVNEDLYIPIFYNDVSDFSPRAGALFLGAGLFASRPAMGAYAGRSWLPYLDITVEPSGALFPLNVWERPGKEWCF